MEQSQVYQTARKRVEAKMGFYLHLIVFVAGILLLVALNFLISSDVLWVQWPVLGWGFALALHAFVVFVFPGGFAVTEKMVEKEIARSETQFRE